MAYDEGLAQTLRAALAGQGEVEERKMFGGLCFMLGGHMVAGVYKGGGMARVGKVHAAAALALPQVRPMEMTGRPMPGIVHLDPAAVADPALRGQVIALAIDFVRSLPPR